MTEAALEESTREIIKILAAYGLDMIAAILILILGWTIARWAGALIRRKMQVITRIDLTLVSFLASFVRYAIMMVTIIAVLSQFGVQTTSLIAMLGAAGLAVGLALQGTLTNVAAGVMLLILRPFRLGDYVEVQGAAGTVKDITLFTTTFTTPDNLVITVPNGQIWGNAVKNFSVNATRRMEIPIGVAYDADLDVVYQTILDEAKAEPRILQQPAPIVYISAYGASSVDLVVRAWAATNGFWDARYALMKRIKERFDRDKIEIPYPHQVSINKDTTPKLTE